MSARPVLTNFLQQAPDCDVALVHDDDLKYIDAAVCLFIC